MANPWNGRTSNWWFIKDTIDIKQFFNILFKINLLNAEYTYHYTDIFIDIDYLFKLFKYYKD